METCDDWMIEISFRILKNAAINSWENILSGKCLQAFKKTVIYLSIYHSTWNNDWCVNVDAKFSQLTNRRMLLQINIEVNLKFDINHHMYLAYFGDKN